jgi:hypothetical protein
LQDEETIHLIPTQDAIQDCCRCGGQLGSG